MNLRFSYLVIAVCLPLSLLVFNNEAGKTTTNRGVIADLEKVNLIESKISFTDKMNKKFTWSVPPKVVKSASGLLATGKSHCRIKVETLQTNAYQYEKITGIVCR